MKSKVDIVFVLLTYRNYEDLTDFIESTKNLQNTNYRIVCVNSYYDETSKLEIKKICEYHDCDFINVENKGYGYGNNQGVKYAYDHYYFDFIIISNPDIVIRKLNLKNKKTDVILAPSIITKDGRKQNPFRLPNNYIVDFIKFKSFEKRNKIFIYLDILFNKIYRELYNLFKIESIISSCHGSFFVIGIDALNSMGLKLFNEKIFLFTEEEHIALLARSKNVKIIMDRSIEVFHKEDGSVNFLNTATSDITRNSYMEFFKYWYDKK